MVVQNCILVDRKTSTKSAATIWKYSGFAHHQKTINRQSAALTSPELVALNHTVPHQGVLPQTISRMLGPARQNSETIAVGHPLALEWPFPAQLNDYQADLKQAQGSERPSRGLDGDRVVRSGDSADCKMAAALNFRLKDLDKRPLKA
ncbi:hypothetical protein BKA67DRAFT_533208 [Truncatella angustata]|uniref:Alpha/beta hydrolase fold-3 domain-containing protein n=1 Tax=Truncatella angustata TaxID=152316 RepID=A0A9P8UT62_9PEZI|nr:uncharacterized protein BKA67DRAFT_533208 [Truncatella angustata]KAH6658032.1 hypothetical protein BKA67DRAFT_533208 [Truncatella angustata]